MIEMSVIRFSCKLFNNTESKAYIYFSCASGDRKEPFVALYVNDKMTEEQYIGFVQRLASDLLRREMITIKELQIQQ